MSERGGVLDLCSGGERDGDAEKTGAAEEEPVVEGAGEGRSEDDGDLSREKDEGEEEEAGVDVVVQGDFPGVVIDQGELLLDEDGVHRDEEGRRDAE